MLACKICVAARGLTLTSRDRLFDTDEELFEHLENVHGQVVMREGETKEAAILRCAAKGIVNDRNTCMCQDCISLRKQGHTFCSVKGVI
jgi:hypothetical protein